MTASFSLLSSLFWSTAAFAVPLDSGVFVTLSKKVVPSVVNISTYTTVHAPRPGQDMDLMRRFFEEMMRRGGGTMPQMPPDGQDGEPAPKRGDKSKLPKAMSLGTGFVIEAKDSTGIILTNNHVVGEADEIQIRFTEEEFEKHTPGEVIGRDPELDLALIKVTTKRELTPLVFGDSDALEVGEYVMAVGNPFGNGHSVTHGIISAKGRISPELPLTRYLQTDAPINPGNSGGPLVNLKGEVIGINNAIDQRAQNIGFAIPVNSVKKVIAQLRSKGSVARGYIGIGVADLTPEVAEKLGVSAELQAPFVENVYEGEPAEKAGVKNYDVIKEVAGKPVRSRNELVNAITSVPVGESVVLTVLRSGKEKKISVRVSERPSGVAQGKNRPKHTPKKPGKNEPVETGLRLQEKGKTLQVVQVDPGSPAEQAGLLPGDAILEVDRREVKTLDDFYAVVKEKKSYLLRVKRTDPQGQDGFSVILLDLK